MSSSLRKGPTLLPNEDNDPLSGALQKAQRLDQERRDLLAAAQDMIRTAQAYLKASDAFQLICGSLSKPSDFAPTPVISKSNPVSPNTSFKTPTPRPPPTPPPPQAAASEASDTQAETTKFMSEMQRFLASDTHQYAQYIQNGLSPLVDFLATLNYDDFSTAKKTVKKKKSGIPIAEDISKEVEMALTSRDQKLYKLFSNLLSCKGKYLTEAAKLYEKHKPNVEAFSTKLKDAAHRQSLVPGSDVLVKRYPEGERLSGEGQIFKAENVGCISDLRFVTGQLTLTHYRIRLVTFEEVDSTTGIVEKDSEVIFDVPVAGIAYAERPEPLKDEVVELHCKDLRELTLSFKRSSKTADLFYNNLTPLTTMDVEKSAFAFYSKETFQNNGWLVYDAKREYARLCIPDNYIRTVSVNVDHKFSPTYPKLLALPNNISDSDIKSSASFRSKSRVITICWRDVRSWKVIARCSQPLVGIANKKNASDEMIIKAIGEWAASTNNTGFYGVGADGKALHSVAIFDARPKVNAIGNLAGGGGYEKVEEMEADLSFLNIENIHVVREGLKALRDLFQRTQAMNEICVNTTSARDSIAVWSEKYYYLWNTLRQSTRSASWFPMLQTIIAGAIGVVEAIQNGRSVIVHCSDGWDRTPQVTSIAELMLDGYYRTIIGFAILVEKEWLSFGHKFGERYGHGKNRAKYQDKQRSPIFIQWLDAVYQIVCQNPDAFEFDTKLLVFLADHLYSCRFGTFLCDSEAEREEMDITSRTVSIWSYIFDNFYFFQNANYEATPSPLKAHANSKDFQLWLAYYIRWDQVLFKNPTSDGDKIVEHFQRNYAQPALFVRRKIIPSAGIDTSKLPSTEKVPSVGDFIQYDEEGDFLKWSYDQMAVKIMETETKYDENSDE